MFFIGQNVKYIHIKCSITLNILLIIPSAIPINLFTEVWQIYKQIYKEIYKQTYKQIVSFKHVICRQSFDV